MSDQSRLVDIAVKNFSLIDNPDFRGNPTEGTMSWQAEVGYSEQKDQVRLLFNFQINQDDVSFGANPYKVSASFLFVFQLIPGEIVEGELPEEAVKELIDVSYNTARGLLFSMVQQCSKTPTIIPPLNKETLKPLDQEN